MHNLTRFFACSLIVILNGCSVPQNAPKQTITQVDLNRYMGKWYEVASLPNRFQKGCRCTNAEYQMKQEQVQILNRCIKDKNKDYSQVKGTAWTVNGSHNTQLKVRFFWPFTGNYWILAVSPSYDTALVGSPDRKYLWILSRKTTMTPSTFSKFADIAKAQGYETHKLNKTVQNCS